MEELLIRSSFFLRYTDAVEVVVLSFSYLSACEQGGADPEVELQLPTKKWWSGPPLIFASSYGTDSQKV